MALTVAVLGSGTNSTAGTSFNLANRTSAPAAGDKVVLVITADNSSSGGSTNDINSVTDALGNTWTKRVSPLFDNGAASAGIQGAQFETDQNAGTLTTTTTITVTTGSSPTQKGWSMYALTPGTSGYVVEYQNGGVNTGATTAAPTVTTDTVQVGEVVIAAYHSENVNATTGDGDTTNGTWAAQTTVTAGATTSGIRHSTQHKVQTTTASTQTFNPTTASSQDCILSWTRWAEVPPGDGPAYIGGGYYG